MFCTHASAPRAHTRNRNAAQKSPLHACLEDRGECLAPFLVDRSMAWESEHCMTRCCVPHPTSRSSLHARASRLSTRPTSRLDGVACIGGVSFTVLMITLMNSYSIECKDISTSDPRPRADRLHSTHSSMYTDLYTSCTSSRPLPPPVIKSRPPRPPAPP